METALNGVERVVQRARQRARAKRASVFRHHFELGRETRIIDIGSENGSAIATVLAGTNIDPSNVFIADVDAERVADGARRYGFVPVPISESGRLPFDDHFFDIVYCSSVIEHVTMAKSDIWQQRSDKEFRAQARQRQREFAEEIRRLGKSYYVQTPNKWFPIESHTWLPVVGFLPRRVQLPVIAISNRYWIKRTAPDWCLLTTKDMQGFFPDAELMYEHIMGLTKSIMAIKK